jgi:hypothetical protein
VGTETEGVRFAYLQPVFAAGGSAKSHTVEVKVNPPPPSFNNEDDEGEDLSGLCYIGVGPFMGTEVVAESEISCICFI